MAERQETGIQNVRYPLAEASTPRRKPCIGESATSAQFDSPLKATTEEDVNFSPSTTDESGSSPQTLLWTPISPFLSDIIGLPKRAGINLEPVLKSAAQFQRVARTRPPDSTYSGALNPSFPVTPKRELNRVETLGFGRLESRVAYRLKGHVRESVEGLVDFVRSLVFSSKNQMVQFVKPSRRTCWRARRLLFLFLFFGGLLTIVNWTACHLFQRPRTAVNQYLTSSPTKLTWLKSLTPANTRAELLSDSEPHPIEKLVNGASTAWGEKVKSQSTSLAEAIREYRKRYHMEPPSGFDRWFKYAQDSQHILVDEYDALMNQLLPYWKLTGAQLRHRTHMLGNQRGFGLVRISDGKVTVQLSELPNRSLHTNLDHLNPHLDLEDRKARESVLGSGGGTEVKEEDKTQTWAFGEVMRKILSIEPQLQLGGIAFAVNEASEPRVVLPWNQGGVDQSQHFGHVSAPDDYDSLEYWEDSSEIGMGGVWDEFKKTCPPQSEARRLFTSVRVQQNNLWSQPRKSSRLRKSRDIDPAKAGLKHDPTKLAMRSPELSETSPQVERRKRPLNHLDLSGDPVLQTRFVNSSFAPLQEIYCTHSKRRVEQGLFFSDSRKLSGYFPVFSSATAQGFGDIVIPSYLHTQDPYRSKRYIHEPVNKVSDGEFQGSLPFRFDDLKRWKRWEVDWASKSDKVHWRGLPIDGGRTPAGLQPNFSRHRLVKKFGSWLSSRSETVIWLALPIRPVSRRFLSFFKQKVSARDPVKMNGSIGRGLLNEQIMDVGFISERGCGVEKACEELIKGGYRFSVWQPFGAVKYFKMALDIDGVGPSARFLNLLASGTAVVKNTIYREYHTDWLMPWVHYIPLSVESDELYNIWSYFLGSDSMAAKLMGKENVHGAGISSRSSANIRIFNREDQLKKIAENGLEWSTSVGREVDWEIYCYRLALEWNRIWNRD